jgi:hypothetical protein
LQATESEGAYTYSGALPDVAADGVTLRVSSDGVLTLTAKADSSHKVSGHSAHCMSRCPVCPEHLLRVRRTSTMTEPSPSAL